MNFDKTEKVSNLIHRLEHFMDEKIYPVEHEYEDFVRNPSNLWIVPL